MKKSRGNILQSVAEDEVVQTLAGLPEELRMRATSVPIVYDSRSLEALDDDDLTDTLGLFVGENLLEAGQGSGGVPPHIILFLSNLWFEADEVETVYRKEVRTTLLHELGHYLGLEERTWKSADCNEPRNRPRNRNRLSGRGVPWNELAWSARFSVSWESSPAKRSNAQWQPEG